ncbi:DUF2141 domain-containing protein [Erythrobacter sp. Alg231-14]|uniref:DUF2141 domain-containing protein n=1 Tax=Erythrobacter sp. Alg231-14 TaxID=1922225 RepID=UPI00307C8F56
MTGSTISALRPIAALAMGIAFTAFAAPAAAATITITVTDLRSDEGVVRACMTTMEDVFPRCARDPNSHRTVVRADDTITIRFENVEPGDYAIALLHDENEDGKANRVLGMAPREGYGFSRDAPVRMAPPDWDDAVFTIGSASQNLTIKMRYFL